MKLASQTMMPIGSGICVGGEDARAGLLVDDDARIVLRRLQASWLVPLSTA